MAGKLRMCCPNCGSEDVSKDAAVRWCFETQQWEVSGIFDNANCDACESELKHLDEVSEK
ncbi:hypothetical protein [Paraburkholderia sp. SIMBA_054]|uniref:hypothetical protein n=1 Tax=Paraburkholderia sp. SIMBA_054 TaxID=3085795 RepID=UPI00397C66AE